jgi:hypothetical protein
MIFLLINKKWAFAYGPAFYFHNEIEKGSYYLEGKQFYSAEEFWNHHTTF